MSDSWRPKQSREDRLSRSQLSMIPGTVQGRIAQAHPTGRVRRDETGTGDVVEAIFSYAGPVVEALESPPYVVTTPLYDVGTIIAGTRSNTSGPTVIEIKKNNTQIATLTLPGGDKTAEVVVEDIDVSYGDHLTARCLSVGGGLTGLTVIVLLSE